MSTYQYPTIAELEAQMIECHAKTDSSLANCEKLITKLEARYLKADEDYSKVQTHLSEYKVNIIAPYIAAAAEQLPATALKLKVAEYDLKRKTEDYKKLEAKHLEACKSEIRVKKEKKQLEKTVVALTNHLDGNTTPDEKKLQTENERLKGELATLKAQLEHKTEECAMKDQFIADLTDDFAAYQDVTSDTLARRHDSCDELNAALDEQCGMLTAERDYLQSHIDMLTVKCDMPKSELEVSRAILVLLS
jgi:chromosome segregation ATPase